MSNYLTRAEALFRMALAEFSRAKKNGNREEEFVQAAEKGWLAAHRATNALLSHYGKKVTAGTQRKEEDLVDLERRYPEIRKSELKARFVNFHSRLHIDAGYMDHLSVKLIERDIRAVGEYIQTVRRLVSR